MPLRYADLVRKGFRDPASDDRLHQSGKPVVGRFAPGEFLLLEAPAKINLFLRVTGRRDDGYHDLQSLVGFAEPCDRLTAYPGEDLALSVTGPFAHDLPAESSGNLVFRAACALRTRFGCRRGARLHLEKNLPVLSGIGGGSSDAAAALRLLAALWDIGSDAAGLMEIGRSLGADVPVCIHGCASMVTGMGEVIEAVPALPDCAVLLVNDGTPLSTRSVFQRGPKFTVASDWSPPASLDELVAALSVYGNDLEHGAVAQAPSVAEVLDDLAEMPDCRFAAMSGSGGTCFGIFPDPAAADAAGRRLLAAHRNWWIRAGRFRTARPLIRRGRHGFTEAGSSC